MKLRLRTKASLTFLVGVVICMIIINVAAAAFLEPILVYDSQKQMKGYARNIESSMSSDEDINVQLYTFLQSYAVTTVIMKDNNIIYSPYKSYKNSEAPNSILKLFNRNIIDEYESQSKDDYFKMDYNHIDRVRKISYVYKCNDSSYIMMVKDTRGIDQDVKLVIAFLISSGSVTAIFGLIVWLIMTRSFTKLFEKMSKVTQNVANLNFDEKIDYKGNDLELQTLANSIDELSIKLSKSINDLEKELDQKSSLLRNLSHEIKTPLTTIKGYTENIQIIEPNNERITKYCKIMVDECDSLDFLANEMLNAASIEINSKLLNKELTNTDEIFDVLEKREKINNFSRHLLVEYDDCDLMVSKELMHSVISNYVDNAIKYSTPNSLISVYGKIVDDCYVISVTNAGKEIDESEKDLIWKAFYRSDKSRNRNGSHGIGLSIVKQIADIHNAEVNVESKNGLNTFYFKLPIQ